MSDNDIILAELEGQRFTLERIRVEQERLAAALERRAAALERLATARALAPPESPIERKPAGRAQAAGAGEVSHRSG